MTRQTAQKILVAHLGQLIQLDTRKVYHCRTCCLSALVPDGSFGYKEVLLYQCDSWDTIIDIVLPEAKDHYDSRFDIIEQSYIDRLQTERKARRNIEKNSRRTILQSDNDNGTEGINIFRTDEETS